MLALLIIANLTITSRLPPNPKPLNVREFIAPLREIPFDLVVFGSFLFFLGMFIPINYIILEALHFGMGPRLAFYMVSILNAASFFGRTVPGYVADKIGRFNMMVIMMFFTASDQLLTAYRLVVADLCLGNRDSSTLASSDGQRADHRLRSPLRIRKWFVRLASAITDRPDIRCAADWC